MPKIIIFDFNRTIFDPETHGLVPGAREVMADARVAGFVLCLISQREGGARAALVQSLGLHRDFDYLYFCDQKTVEQFEECLRHVGEVDRQRSFVVGDRVRSEVVCGNACGLQTIWIRTGKFANELPERPEEQPTFCVGSLVEIIPIFRRG